MAVKLPISKMKAMKKVCGNEFTQFLTYHKVLVNRSNYCTLSNKESSSFSNRKEKEKEKENEKK
jgi:hypothetical protein